MLTKSILLVLGMIGGLLLPSFGQITYTANNKVPPNSSDFRYGAVNGSYTNWNNVQIAYIAAGKPLKGIKGAGVRSFREALPESFLLKWKYPIRVNTFKSYDSLNIKHNTVFLEGPSVGHRETAFHCPTSQSKVFSNLYTDIWDGGANGTPVNDNNYFALYVYNTVLTYKNYVKFWEIWNEPDYTSKGNGWKSSGMAGNWYDNNPGPCELDNLQAPVFSYIRMLRIAYEVIKYVDPNAYVAVGGIGYASFLDAVLRNTDNPSNGVVSSQYPLKGGAYFDVLSYHSYPHGDGSLTLPGGGFKRHSDAAAEGVVNKKFKFQEVLSKHGYNGNTYPNKIWIITESNIPRLEVGNNIGGDLVQKNFIIKALVNTQKADIKQFYVFVISDRKPESEATASYDLMGLYKRLSLVKPFEQVINNEGKAYKTTSDMLLGAKYDSVRTKVLNLPNSVGGGAFKNKSGRYAYVLWAKTTVDRSENASATYTFPQGLNISSLNKMEWDYSYSRKKAIVNATAINLTGSPIFLTEATYVSYGDSLEGNLDGISKKMTSLKLNIHPNPITENSVLSFELPSPGAVGVAIYDFHGRKVSDIIQNARFNAGANEIELFGNSEKLPQGIYFCQVEVEGGMDIIKLVVMEN